MNYSESEKAERRMLIKLREADFFTQRDSLVEQIKSLAPTQFFKDTQKKWEKAIKAKDRVTEEITSSVSLKPLSGKEQFLLAMQVDLLRKELGRLRERYGDLAMPEEIQADSERDPIRREQLQLKAAQKRAANTPEAKDSSLLLQLIQGLSKVTKPGSKLRQDITPAKPFFHSWGNRNLEMTIYDLSDGTAVSRTTLKRFMKLHRFKRLRTDGRLAVYGADTCIAVAKKWLSAKKWHVTQDNQKYWLLEFLYQIQTHNPELFPGVTEQLFSVLAEVSKRSHDFRESFLVVLERYKNRNRRASQFSTLLGLG